MITITVKPCFCQEDDVQLMVSNNLANYKRLVAKECKRNIERKKERKRLHYSLRKSNRETERVNMVSEPSMFSTCC